MKRAKLAELLRKDYVQTVIMIIIAIAIIIFFWYSLRVAFRTEHPFLAVASGSMEPVLYRGDLILVQGVQNACEIHAAPKEANPPGDIIVFEKPGYPGELIVHRAIKKIIGTDGSCMILTQGDANPTPDDWKIKKIEGKYTGVKVPLLGYVALFFQPFEVKVAFILLWIVLLVILEFSLSSKKKGEEKQV